MNETRGRVLLAFAVSLLLAAPLLAVEGEEVGSPFSGDLGNAIWTLVIFIAVVLVLGRFAWGPMLRALQSREEYIRESLAKAKEEREAAEARHQEYNRKLTEAHNEAAAIVEEARRDASALKTKIEADARAEADKSIHRAKREIGIAKDAAIKELYTLTAELSTRAASRIVGRELTVADQERLIRESLDELGEN